MPVYELGGVRPELPQDGDCWVAPGAQVMGQVTLRAGASVWSRTAACCMPIREFR